MTKGSHVLPAVAALALLWGGPARANAGSPWIHIQVTDDGQSKVHVNLPLSLVQVALEVAPEKLISEGRIHIDHHYDHDLSVADLRRLWQELRESGEAEFVSVEEDDESIRFAREGDLLRIDIEERYRYRDEDADQVHIEVPVALVDALLSGEDEELNLRDALDELENQRGEIVRVEDGESKVLIWIDERN